MFKNGTLHGNGKGITRFTQNRVDNSAIAQLTHNVHYMNRLPTARDLHGDSPG